MKRFLQQCLFFGHYIILANAMTILTGSPQLAVLGQDVNVTLKCVVDVDNTAVVWKKGDDTVANIQVDSSGNCTGMPPDTPYIFKCNQISRTYYLILQLRNLTESENAVEWRCIRLFGPTSSLWSISIAVSVTTVTITPPGKNGVIHDAIGGIHTFICTTDSSRPAAWIQWYIGGDNDTNQAQPQTPQPDGDKFISSSSLVHTWKEADHNKTIYCEAVNIKGRKKVKSTEILIFVNLPVTKVTIISTGINNVANIVVGGDQTFTCSTDSGRPAAWIQWYIGVDNVTDQTQPQTPQPDGDKLISSSSFVYTGKDADHNKSIHCEAVNIDGRDTVKSKNISIFLQIPVTTVTMTPTGINNVASIVDGGDQTFTCSTNPSRPAALIQWYIGVENVTDQAKPQTPQPDGDKYISSSIMVYNGKDADHGKNIYCEAANIDGRNKIKSTEISIYIQLPVTAVSITPTGINNIADLIVGSDQTFTCSTDSSRPAAWIQWYIGVDNVTAKAQPQTPQPDSDKFISSSRLVYTGKDDDHNKNIYCEAVNIAGRDKVKSTEISIVLQLPVTTVTITPTGINNVLSIVVGGNQLFTCSTNPGRPAAWIQWYIGVENVTDQAQPQTSQPDGDKFISSSRLVYTGKDADHGKNIYCEAVNIEGRDKIKSSEISIYIKLSVTTVAIKPAGMHNEADIIVGSDQTFTCSTGSSRPAAWIQWYIGVDNVTDQAQPQTPQPDGDKFISSSRLVYTGKDDDHNKNIYCEAINIEGRDKIKSRNILIYIFVPVETVTITPDGNSGIINVEEGMTQTFNCTTDSSRPAASIQWYIGDKNVTDQAQPQLPKPNGNQYISSSSFVYTGTDDDHNKDVYCDSINIVGREKVQSGKNTIHIQFGPKNITLHPATGFYTVTEANSIGMINCSASCRPDCNITWTGPVEYITHQSYLHFKSVFRNQSGIYSCKAINAFGIKSSTNINLTVNYPPNILHLQTQNGNIIKENTTVTLNCEIDSHPLSEVNWFFTKNNSLLYTTQNSQQSYYNIERADCFRTGTYQCLAKNIIDELVRNDSKTIDLYIQCSPRSDVRKPMQQNIIGIDDNGILNITVYLIAYPQPSITWTFINTETGHNMSVASNNTFSSFEHVSTIQDLQIDKTDYGVYTIHASNNIGEDYIRIFTIKPQTKPDPPANMSVDCDTISMTVAWRSEFDGGDPQIFNVQWWNPNTNTTITSNDIPDEGKDTYHIITTELLSPSSLYVVFVEASNVRGTVRSKEDVNCTTRALPETDKSNSATTGIIGGILGFVFALLVVTGVLITVRHRRHHKEDKEPIKGSKKTEVGQDDDVELQENPLYITSGHTSGEDNGPVYSEVKKPKKALSVENRDQNAIYSQIDKIGKKGKQKQIAKNTEKERENGSLYENSEKLMKTQSHEEYANTYGNTAEVTTKGHGYTPKKNKDGLIYADLELKPIPSGRRFVIRGIENRNNYAILDLTKTAEPLPSDDNDDEKENSGAANDIDDT